MQPLVTTKKKDDTLQWLCSNIRLGKLIEFELTEILSATSVDEDTMEAILEDFEEIGLIASLNPMRSGSALILKLKAHDLLQNGGFAVIDALNEANIQKLLFELENLQKQLKPDQLDAFNKIASIASSIATVLTAFSSKSQ